MPLNESPEAIPMKIVHVETGRHLYGGAQQVLWLVEGLAASDVEGLLVSLRLHFDIKHEYTSEDRVLLSSL